MKGTSTQDPGIWDLGHNKHPYSNISSILLQKESIHTYIHTYLLNIYIPCMHAYTHIYICMCIHTASLVTLMVMTIC